MTTIVMNAKTAAVAWRLPNNASQEDMTEACKGVPNAFVESLENLTLTELVRVYNKLTGADLKKFSDKATAVNRVEVALQAAEVPTYTPGAAPTKPGRKPKASTTDRSAAIAASWQDPTTAKKRATRHSVTMGRETYRSVKQAFEILGLPMGQHIPFRMKLKKEGQAIFEHEGKKYKFTAHQAES